MNPSSEPSAVRRLATALTATDGTAFDAATLHKAKLHLLDTLGAALAGSGANETRLVLEGLGLDQGTGRSPVWGTPLRLSPRDSSFVNGVAAHAYELDDSGGCDHSGAVVLPAAMSLARPGTSGAQLLRAMILGYEVARRVLEACGGYESHNGCGWHSTGTCGVFGAAAAAGLLLGLDADGLANAMGIAASYAGGTWAFIADGSQTKKLHSGRAAAGGVTAALLAAQGFTGPDSILDGEGWGSFLTTYNPAGAVPAALLADYGDFWRINRCSIKPYATCRGTHSVIDALEQLLAAHRLSPDQIDRLAVDISRFQFGMCGGMTIESRAEAQMSIAYALAARLAFGAVGLAELEEAVWRGDDWRPWLARIALHIDEAMADDAEPRLTLVTRDGRRRCACVPYPLGSPQNPLSEERIVDKFRNLAGLCLDAEHLESLIDLVMRLEQLTDLTPLLRLLATPSAIPARD